MSTICYDIPDNLNFPTKLDTHLFSKLLIDSEIIHTKNSAPGDNLPYPYFLSDKFYFMKKIFCLVVICLFVFVAGKTQSIFMSIAGVTGGQSGEEIKALELKMDAPVNTGGGGSGPPVGITKPGLLMVKKINGTSTTNLFEKMIAATKITEVIFTYNDNSNTPYFIITLTDAYLAQFYWLSPECPTCIKLEHQLGFTFAKMKIQDLVAGTTKTWDVAGNIIN